VLKRYNLTLGKFVPKDNPDIIFLNFQHFVALDVNDSVPTFCVWNHAHAQNVRVDLERSVAALDGMKS
jgi:hypothetical protein